MQPGHFPYNFIMFGVAPESVINHSYPYFFLFFYYYSSVTLSNYFSAFLRLWKYLSYLSVIFYYPHYFFPFPVFSLVKIFYPGFSCNLYYFKSNSFACLNRTCDSNLVPSVHISPQVVEVTL